MTVVLDAPAIVAIAADSRKKRTAVEMVLEREVCYMSAVAAAEAYSWLLNNAGSAFAEHWLNFLLSGRDVRVDCEIDREMIELVGQARRQSRKVAPSGAFSAALARKLGVPLMTDDPNLEDLETHHYCTIRWL